SRRSAPGQAKRRWYRREREACATHLGAPAAFVATDVQPGRPASHSLPARRVGQRLPGGARGAARQGCAKPVTVGDRASEGGVGGRVCPLATAGSVGAALRVWLG